MFAHDSILFKFGLMLCYGSDYKIIYSIFLENHKIEPHVVYPHPCVSRSVCDKVIGMAIRSCTVLSYHKAMFPIPWT